MAACVLVPASRADIPACMAILNAGRDFQRAQGFVQWSDGYPACSDVEKDIASGGAFLLKTDGLIAAYLFIGFDGDPAYPAIDGAWHCGAPYAVIHRLAISTAFRGQGLSSTAFRLAAQYCAAHGYRNLRIDTHSENLRMQHILTKNGFSYCGIVIQNGSNRMAFDKVLA